MQTDNRVTQREKAKEKLKTALANCNGNTQQEAVVNAIADLTSLNPTPNPAQNATLLQGNWLLISAPNFPGKLVDEANRYVYTLGRLAFNKFEPVNLRVVLEQVSQPVLATRNANEYSHDIVVNFKIVEPNFPELLGVIKNLAVCSPVSGDTVKVKFTGGEIAPLAEQNSAQMTQWLEVFGSNLTSSITIWERLQFWFVQTMFGISKVTPINRATGKKSFAINKSPQGTLKILYLDEELRITKGNRETVLVCQRII